MLRDAADDAYYLLSKERRLELAGIFCQGPAATQHAIAEQPIHLQIWTAMIALLGMLVAQHMLKVALVPDGQKQAAFVV